MRREDRQRRSREWAAAFEHTRERVEERYGMTLDVTEYGGMLGAVLDPAQDTLVINRNDGSSLHAVTVKGRKIIVLLDPDRNLIKTAYPEDAMLLKHWMLE